MKITPLVLVWSALLLASPFLHANDWKADFHKMIDRPRVPFAPIVERLPNADQIEKYHFSYSSEKNVRVPGLLYKKPGNEKRPVVIVAHGTEESKDEYTDLLTLLANKGFIAVAIDGRFFGERITYGDTTFEYCDQIAKAYYGSGAHPLYYDTVWDDLRLLDYLETRSDVDALRIGMTGFSKGGIETYLTTALDDRIAVAVPLISMQSFKWELENNSWYRRVNSFQKAFDQVVKLEGIENPDAAFVAKFYDRVIPGIYGPFDGPHLITQIAPRPLLVINSDKDGLTPQPSVEICIAAAQKAYAADHASNRFKYIFQDSDKHLITPTSLEEVVNWFTRWLKP